jgi:glycosyltransferase involved in cell wall biosynthesis
MRDLLSDPARLRAMGQAARQRAERLLSWERSTRRLERIYLGLDPEDRQLSECVRS